MQLASETLASAWIIFKSLCTSLHSLSGVRNYSLGIYRLWYNTLSSPFLWHKAEQEMSQSSQEERNILMAAFTFTIMLGCQPLYGNRHWIKRTISSKTILNVWHLGDNSCSECISYRQILPAWCSESTRSENWCMHKHRNTENTGISVSVYHTGYFQGERNTSPLGARRQFFPNSIRKVVSECGRKKETL